MFHKSFHQDIAALTDTLAALTGKVGHTRRAITFSNLSAVAQEILIITWFLLKIIST